MCSSSSTRQNEQKPIGRPSASSRQKAERHARVLQLGQVHLPRPRVGERRLLDREDLVDLVERGDRFGLPRASVLDPRRSLSPGRFPRPGAGRTADARPTGARWRRAARNSTASRPMAPARSGGARSLRDWRHDRFVQHGAVADEHGRQTPNSFDHRAQRRRRAVDARRLDLDETIRVERPPRPSRGTARRRHRGGSASIHAATCAPADSPTLAQCANASSAEMPTMRRPARTPAPEWSRCRCAAP